MIESSVRVDQAASGSTAAPAALLSRRRDRSRRDVLSPARRSPLVAGRLAAAPSRSSSSPSTLCAPITSTPTATLERPRRTSTRWRPKGFSSSMPSPPWRPRCRRHVSLFSGVYAHQHGVAENRWGRAPFAEGEDGLRSAAQLLRDDGFTTAAFVSAAPVKRVTSMAAGFNRFESRVGYEDRRARRRRSQAIAWLEQVRGSRSCSGSISGSPAAQSALTRRGRLKFASDQGWTR